MGGACLDRTGRRRRRVKKEGESWESDTLTRRGEASKKLNERKCRDVHKVHLLCRSIQRSRWVRALVVADGAISRKLAYFLRALFPWQIPYSDRHLITALVDGRVPAQNEHNSIQHVWSGQYSLQFNLRNQNMRIRISFIINYFQINRLGLCWHYSYYSI
jgi:hypothetical protein